MAVEIPPPPTNSPQGDRVWTDWFIKLGQALRGTAGVAWALIDKSGSSLSDIVTRNHSQLTSIQGTGSFHVSNTEASFITSLLATGHAALSAVLGTGDRHITSGENTVVTSITTSGHQGLGSINGTGNYHVSSAEATALTALNTNGAIPLQSKAGDPTTSDIAAGKAAVFKNTSLGEIRLWVNDGGTVKKSATLT